MEQCNTFLSLSTLNVKLLLDRCDNNSQLENILCLMDSLEWTCGAGLLTNCSVATYYSKKKKKNSKHGAMPHFQIYESHCIALHCNNIACILMKKTTQLHFSGTW